MSSLESYIGSTITPHPNATQLGFAFELALCHHSAQKDLAGEPYMLHLMRVCLAVKTDAQKTVALLHDVVEDGHLTLEHLDDYFSDYITNAVDAITKRKGETYANYLTRVKGNKVALAVKLADIADNSDEDRLARLDEITAARLREKYRTAFKTLAT